MSGLVKSSFSLLKRSIFSTSVRAIVTTKQLHVKEIREQTVGSTLVVEGVPVPSPRKDYLVRAENLVPVPEPLVKSEQPPCYMCALGLEVKHTDVLILSQFVRSDGCMLPRRITGLCRRQQKKIGKMVTMAQKAGLMINLTPKNCAKDPKKRYQHKKFNTYFDESTIFMKRIPKPWEKFRR
ncbi:28S ribosomal protein S18a, mitochondrial [Galleria mellonella]|uniref:28S ribosomal protein S18a, mitochondrial n=1 Tax=Galleria mellonella TaxID=7137 RepID=A0A6J1X004_GALME|nr:28S ribosomal protein S18a, mitochondrial [Galleria mellonella]